MPDAERQMARDHDSLAQRPHDAKGENGTRRMEHPGVQEKRGVSLRGKSRRQAFFSPGVSGGNSAAGTGASVAVGAVAAAFSAFRAGPPRPRFL
jgi:hypothetical protein